MYYITPVSHYEDMNKILNELEFWPDPTTASEPSVSGNQVRQESLIEFDCWLLDE